MRRTAFIAVSEMPYGQSWDHFPQIGGYGYPFFLPQIYSGMLNVRRK